MTVYAVMYTFSVCPLFAGTNFACVRAFHKSLEATFTAT